MKEVTDFIEQKIQEILFSLSEEKHNKEQLIEKKDELKEILYFIEICKAHNLKKKNVHSIFSIPEQNTGYSDFRIMNDCETEQREFWIELDPEKRLCPNDIVIKLK